MLPRAIVLILAAGPFAAVQDTPVLERFRDADAMGKRRMLSESVLGKRPATEADIRELLRAAMHDPDPSVRADAVGTVASIRTLCAMPQLVPGQEWALRWGGAAEALQDELDAAADDPDDWVRQQAIRGIVAPFVQTRAPAPAPRAVLLRLAGKFDADPSARVRATALQSLGWFSAASDPEARTLAVRTLLKGLEDTEATVVQAAAHVVMQSAPWVAGADGIAPPPDALPLLVRQLRHPSREVRMSVAQAIAGYGAMAARYMPQIEAALAVETDDITRKTLQGTIAVIRR